MPRYNNKIPIFKSSGNVFADLRLPSAQEKHTKVRLAVAINRAAEMSELPTSSR
jgi:hypothetical protein